MSALSGCTAGSGEPATPKTMTCFAPEALQVQVAHDPGQADLMIASGGIGATGLAAEAEAAPTSGRDGADGRTPLRDLPPGVHARIADLSSGEVVRAETLDGGVARAEALPEGDYLVGLVSVEQPGRIDGVATAELQIDERHHLIGTPSVTHDRRLPVPELELSGGTLRAQVDPEEGASAEAAWWLDDPEDGVAGTAGEDGVLSVEGVSDGAHTLTAAAGSERAPGIVEQAVRCEFGATDGQLAPTPGGVRTGSSGEDGSGPQAQPAPDAGTPAAAADQQG